LREALPGKDTVVSHKTSVHCLSDRDLEQVVGGADCSPNFAAFTTCTNVSDCFASLGLSDQAKSFHDMGVAYGKPCG
jgi:hypothetical protein